MTATDTKSYWRRRALKAESETELLREFRKIDAEVEGKMISEHAAMRVTLEMIKEALAGGES